jgi:hypothetical protein
VTIPSVCPRRFPGLRLGRARAVGFSLALITLSLNLPEAPAADPSLQHKNHETPYALIFGTVWGPDDKPVYGVKVKIRREDEKKTRWEVYSDHNGEFAQRVPAGKADYVAWTDLKGHKSIAGVRLQSGDKVAIHVEYDERADTSLHLR